MANNLRFDLTGLAKLCVGALWLTIVAELVYLWDVFNVRAFLDLSETGTMGEAELLAAGEALDARTGMIAIGYMAVFGITVIISAIWIYRASWNAREIQPDAARITPGWAVGWFFVPIMALWKPFQAMRQCWNSSHNPGAGIDAPVPALVGWWWGLWVVTSLLSNANFRLSMRAESIDDFRTTTMLDLIIGPLSVVGALLFIRLIQSITKAQRDASPGLAAVFA